jgi:hypothetical protein
MGRVVWVLAVFFGSAFIIFNIPPFIFFIATGLVVSYNFIVNKNFLWHVMNTTPWQVIPHFRNKRRRQEVVNYNPALKFSFNSLY